MSTHRARAIVSSLSFALILTALLVTWAAPGRAAAAQGGDGIFVPAPRNEGESLDDGQAGHLGPDSSPHRVVTRLGDSLRGHVLTIEETGSLRMVSPYFDGEARILLSGVASIMFAPRAVEFARDRVVLAGGDRIAGELIAVTDAAVLIETGAAGYIKVPRSAVQSIACSQETQLLLESEFALGEMGLWQPVSGTWRVAGGELTCQDGSRRGTGRSVIAARLDQDEAVTVEATARGNLRNLNCQISMFAAGAASGGGNSAVVVHFLGTRLSVGYFRRGDYEAVETKALDLRDRRGAVLRCGYDPTANTVHAWVDETDLGEYRLPFNVNTGRYIVLSVQNELALPSIRVHHGIVPPSRTVAQPLPDRDTIVLANGDTVTVKSLAVEDGRARIATQIGELNVPLDEIAHIVFHTRDDHKVKPVGDVVIRTATSRFTLKLHSMEADHLVGTSDVYGQVRLSRDLIRQIYFIADQ